MAFLQIPRKVDYGLRAVIYLSNQDLGRYCSIAEIAQRQLIPQKFLEKILQDLIRGGLVKSKRGPEGGYVLAKPPREISFQDVVEALDGPIAVNVCLDQSSNCGHLPRCTMTGVWSEIQRKVTEVFTQTNLADLQPAPQHTAARPSSLSSAA